MADAFAWGLLAASSLVLGACVAVQVRIGLRTVGLIMGFSAGVLLSAVAFDLIEEAVGKASGTVPPFLGSSRAAAYSSAATS